MKIDVEMNKTRSHTIIFFSRILAAIFFSRILVQYFLIPLFIFPNAMQVGVY